MVAANFGWSAVAAAAASGAALLLLVVAALNVLDRRGRPPGPRHAPLLGGLLSALRLPPPGGLAAHFAALRKAYGDVFSLRIGCRDVVVINGYENVKEALCNAKNCLNGRPRILWTDITGGKGVFSSEGKLWSEQRRAIMQMLHQLHFDDSHRCAEAVELEAKAVCAGLLGSAAASGKGEEAGCFVEPQRLLDAALCNVSSEVVLGRRFDASDPFFGAVSALLDDVFLHAGLQNMANYENVFRHLPGDFYKCGMLKSHASTAASYIQSVIAERSAYLKDTGYGEPSTFIDMYLAKIEEQRHNASTTFTDEQLLITAVDLFAMSIEAPSTTLRWAFLILAENQDVQSRLHEEIDAVIGSDRVPAYSDKEKMPYTRAFIIELHRYANVVALNLPHSTTEDVVFKGFKIRKGTIVVPNLTSIHFDPNLFPEPERFNPDRFVSPANKSDSKRASANSPDCVVPFSMGPRICLGKAIAEIEIFLFLTNILQKVKITHGYTEEPKRRFGLIESPTKFPIRVHEREPVANCDESKLR